MLEPHVDRANNLTHQTKNKELQNGCDWEEPHLSVVGAFNVEVTGYKGHMVDPLVREVGNIWHLHFNHLWERRRA